MNCEELRNRMLSFPSKYIDNFDHVWKWKMSIEDEYNSILDEEHRSETFKRLVNILRKWQAYRNGKNSSTYKTLKESLLNIEKSYNEINSYSILEFNDIPVKALQRVWHELGRVKELEGKTNDRGIYYAIAACKPLLLIWGQTLAFDTRVRENVPRYYGIRKLNIRLSYKQWYNAMIGLSDDLKRQPKCIATIEKLSQDRYGADSPVPYGRYLDIYYWEGK